MEIFPQLQSEFFDEKSIFAKVLSHNEDFAINWKMTLDRGQCEKVSFSIHPSFQLEMMIKKYFQTRVSDFHD